MRILAILALAAFLPSAHAADRPAKQAPAKPAVSEPKEAEEEMPLKIRLHRVLEKLVVLQDQFADNLAKAKKLGTSTKPAALKSYAGSLQALAADTMAARDELINGLKQKDAPQDEEAQKMARGVGAYAENLQATAGEIRGTLSAYSALLKKSGDDDSRRPAAGKALKTAAELEKTCKQLSVQGKWFETALK